MKYSWEKVQPLTTNAVRLFNIYIGDYQFDIYRIMRAHNGGRWENFDPLTNVMVRILHHSAFVFFSDLFAVVALSAR